MKNIIVYKNEQQYSSFPSIVKSNENQIMVAFRVAGKYSALAAKNNLVTHHDNDSMIQTIVSDDKGLTWDTENTKSVYQFENKQGVNDPGLTLLGDNTLLLRICVLNILPSKRRSELDGLIISHREEHGLISSIKGNLILKSKDFGQNWKKVCFIEDSNIKPFCSRESIIELQDKTLILSGYRGAPYTTDNAILLRSYDEGKSWGDESVIFSDSKGTLGQHYGTNYNETSLLNLGQGALVALGRSDNSFFNDQNEYMPVGGVGELTFSESHDNGLSWYPPKPTGLFGQPAHMIMLKDGRILSTYGYRKNPYGIRACVSQDRGKSWGKEKIIRNDGLSWDLGYPCSIELSSKEIFTVYYLHDEIGIRYIAGTHWRLD